MHHYRIKQEHGLGDAVALTVILRHLRAADPGCRIELIVKPGRESLYRDADEVSTADDLRRPPTHLLQWIPAGKSYREHPSTWAERCLIEQFGITPQAELCRYQVKVDPTSIAEMRRWLEGQSGTRARFALCHFRGASHKERKDVSDYQAASIALELDRAGYAVLIWDANDATPLPEQGIGQRVPAGLIQSLAPHLDAHRLAALIAAVDLFIGVDSGPLHLASAVGARAIGLWTRQSPLHCICHDDTTTHLILKNGVPEYERFLIHRPIDDGLSFFRAHYRHRYCDDFGPALRDILQNQGRH